MATLNRKDLRTTTCAMQHRHFATIAAIIRELDDDDLMRIDWRSRLAMRFASHLATTNSHFDKARFLAACGVED